MIIRYKMTHKLTSHIASFRNRAPQIRLHFVQIRASSVVRKIYHEPIGQLHQRNHVKLNSTRFEMSGVHVREHYCVAAWPVLTTKCPSNSIVNYSSQHAISWELWQHGNGVARIEFVTRAVVEPNFCAALGFNLPMACHSSV